jgi:hypothetical protein
MCLSVRSRLSTCTPQIRLALLQVAERTSNAFDLRIVTSNEYSTVVLSRAVGMLSVYLTSFRCVNI